MTEIHTVSSYGPTAGSARVRLDDWLKFLGIEAKQSQYAGLSNNRPRSIVTHPGTVARAEYLLRRLDVSGERVILSREASPFSRGEVEEQLLRRATRGTYDFDDALFHDQSPIHRFLGTQDKCRRAVVAADVVIAGNDYLANWAERYGRDVRVIPSCINPRDYEPKTDWSINDDIPNIVWLGSLFTEHYVAQIAPALLEMNRRTGAKLTLISGAKYNSGFGRLNRMIRRVPWCPDTFASEIAKADVAIAPLDSAPYSRGKCAYKLLQYAATCVPIVGSPVGANQLALKRFDGIEARSMDDWIQGLTQIVTGASSERAARGIAGRAAVEAHYSFDAWRAPWCDATGVQKS